MKEKPTLKAIHICNSHQPKLKSKIAKEYVFANADKQKKEHRTHNKVLPKWRVKYFYERFLQVSTLEYLLNFTTKNPPLRQYPKRCPPLERTLCDWKSCLMGIKFNGINYSELTAET